MATSAFRSSTRRGGQFDSGEPNPLSLRSRRDSSSGRSSHRRSNSISDFSPKYLSDCSSSYRSGGRRGGRSSVCPSDSENDLDYVPLRGQRQYKNADSEDERSLSIPFFVTKVNQQRGSFRRLSSSVDFSQNASDLRPNNSASDIDLREDATQDLAEEKTIGAVHSQMKSLRGAPPAGDSGSSDFLDTLRSEIRRAVGEIRGELEEIKKKNCKPLEASDEGKPTESRGTDVVQAVADIRKEYSTKFEQSEKRVRELWSQLAIEEQRCSELAKIVKELLPTPVSATPQSSIPTEPVNRKRSHKRRNSAEKHVVSRNLENEAQKYFEECVSISPLDYQGDSDGSYHEVVQHCESAKDGSIKQICSDGETLLKKADNVAAMDTTNVSQEDEQSNSPFVGSDGVALPWLSWETEAVVTCTDKEKVGNKNQCSSSYESHNSPSGSKHPFHGHDHTKLKFNSKGRIALGNVMNGSSIGKVSLGGGYDELGYKKGPKIPGTVRQVCKSSMPTIFTMDDKLVLKSYDYPDVDILMSERIRCRSRVERGELILCQGLLW